MLLHWVWFAALPLFLAPADWALVSLLTVILSQNPILELKVAPAPALLQLLEVVLSIRQRVFRPRVFEAWMLVLEPRSSIWLVLQPLA